MFGRFKSFLPAFGLCLLPLLLLAGLNYWNHLRLAAAAAQTASSTRPARATSNDSITRILADAPAQTNTDAARQAEFLFAQAKRNVLIELAAAIFFAALAALIVTNYRSRHETGLRRVTEGVEAIAKGQLDYQIDLKSKDDLRPLADNVGLMTKQLRDQLAREAETKQFQSFVRLSAVLTHDLKNAIEALSLTVSNMERHYDNEEFRADAMTSLTGATDNLKALVARLSNPVDTLSGEHKRPQPVDLVPMLRRVIALIAEPARAQHDIVISLPNKLLALVDEERIQKVAENLMINALEAMSDKRGTLTITGGLTAPGRVFFSIGDTGQGMTERFIQERLFHAFATTKRRGVGLGLYTCREVVNANGGSIEVSSQPGVGTTFSVMLPSAGINGGSAELQSKPTSL